MRALSIERAGVPDDRLLIPGQTCWRTDRADRFACIVDAAEYFRHVKAAMLRARRRIILIGWDFDARTTFERGAKTLPGPNQLGAFLYWMLWKRPALDVYLLKSNLRLLKAFDGVWFGLTPVSLLNQISSSRIQFAVDGAHPARWHSRVARPDVTPRSATAGRGLAARRRCSVAWCRAGPGGRWDGELSRSTGPAN